MMYKKMTDFELFMTLWTLEMLAIAFMVTFGFIFLSLILGIFFNTNLSYLLYQMINCASLVIFVISFIYAWINFRAINNGEMKHPFESDDNVYV
jgi:uncharacterized membrane protein